MQDKELHPSRRLAFKLMAGLLFYLGAAPVFLCAGVGLAGSLGLSFALPGLGLILTFGAGLLPAKRRRLGFAAALLLTAGVSAALVWRGTVLPPLFLIPVLWMMLLYMPAMARPAGLEWPLSYLSAGVIVHLIGQILKGQAIFAPAAPWLSLLFSGYLLLMLFTLNRHCLMDGMGADKAIPGRLLNRNRGLLILLAALAVAGSFWRALGSAAQAAWIFLRNGAILLVLWLMSVLGNLFAQEESAPMGDGSASMPLPMEQAEPSPLAVILEKVFTAIGLILAAALVLFALYHLGKLLKRLFKMLLGRIREYSKAIGESYEDKVESLFDWDAVRHNVGSRLQSIAGRFVRPPAWDSLSPGEKVRRAYALLLRRGKDVTPSLTAREALVGGRLPVDPKDAEKAAATYEAARYGTRPITPEEAAFMKKSAGV